MLRRLLFRRRGRHRQRGGAGSSGGRAFLLRSSRVGVVGGAVARVSAISIEDLVQPLWRHQHRLRRRRGVLPLVDDAIRHSKGFSCEEWRLCVGPRQLLELLHKVPKVTELLQNFLLESSSSSPRRPCPRVVWLSDSHFLLCAGRDGLSLLSSYPVMCTLDCNDALGQAISLCHFFEDDENDDDEQAEQEAPRNPDPEAAEILAAVHRLVALNCQIAVVNANVDVVAPHDVEAMVSQAQSPRTINLYTDEPHLGEDGNAFVVPAGIGRVLAFSCSARVELIALLEEWEDLGAALAAAMFANRCPTRLVLNGLDDPDTAALMAPALASTRRVETLTIFVDGGDVAHSVWDAIGRNNGIRALVFDSFSSPPLFLESLWTAILKSPTICSVEFRGRAMVYDDWERRECAEAVAKLIRSNRVLSSIAYDPTNHDASIMEARVVPILRVNRLRPLLTGLLLESGRGIGGGGSGGGGGGGASGGERAASLLLGAPLVRQTPELLYLVLKSCHGHLCLRGGGDDRAPSKPPVVDVDVPTNVISDEPECRARSVRWARVH